MVEDRNYPSCLGLYFPLIGGPIVRNNRPSWAGRVSRIGVATPILAIAPGRAAAHSGNLLAVGTTPQRPEKRLLSPPLQVVDGPSWPIWRASWLLGTAEPRLVGL